MRCVVTGAAGFIGSHLCEFLLSQGDEVIGIDCFTDYYDPRRKEINLVGARQYDRFQLQREDLLRAPLVELLDGADVVFHLAGQPGVRPSWGADFATYVWRNVLATQALLEAARVVGLAKLVYASSSSVYGDAESYPTAETLRPRPVSPYGVTKLAAEHLCELYRVGFGVPTVSLRLFTVYGPRQRPDMAFSRLVAAGLRGGTFELFGEGTQTRDFTYVRGRRGRDAQCRTVGVHRGGQHRGRQPHLDERGPAPGLRARRPSGRRAASGAAGRRAGHRRRHHDGVAGLRLPAAGRPPRGAGPHGRRPARRRRPRSARGAVPGRDPGMNGPGLDARPCAAAADDHPDRAGRRRPAGRRAAAAPPGGRPPCAGCRVRPPRHGSRPAAKGARLAALLLLAVDAAAFAVAMVLTGTTGLKTLTVLVLAVALFHGADLYRARLSLSVLDDAPAIVGRALAAGAGAMVLGGLGRRGGRARPGWAPPRSSASCAWAAGASPTRASGRPAATTGCSSGRCSSAPAPSPASLAGNLLAHPEYGLRPEGLLDDDPLLCLDERPVPAAGQLRRPQPGAGRARRRRRHRHLRPRAGAVRRRHAPGLRPAGLRDLLRPPALRAAHGHQGHRGPLGRAAGPPAPGAVPDRHLDGQADRRRRPRGARAAGARRRSSRSARC